MDYKNKVALITGGSSGIGLEVACLLAEQGAHTWLMARNLEKLETAKKTVEAHRKTSDQVCRVVSADVADAVQAEAVVRQVSEESGVPDLVINSAGVCHPGRFEYLTLDIIRWTMETNFFGTVNIIQSVLPAMIQRGSGAIVNYSSVAGFLGVYGYTAYSSSKYAVRGFSDALRSEVKPLGIQVSIVFPPDTDTPGLDYENNFKPQEMVVFEGKREVLTPRAVARATLEGVSKGRFMIFPGMESKIWYFLTSLAGPLTYPIIDILVAGAIKKVGIDRSSQKNQR
jgi:3-dehydrosphinganine reductase